jgi:parallel beta-helix repeat protein
LNCGCLTAAAVRNTCVGTYEVVTLKRVKSASQQAVGIYVDEGASDVIIVGCDVRENSEYGIYVKGNAAEVIIGSCDARVTRRTQ